MLIYQKRIEIYREGFVGLNNFYNYSLIFISTSLRKELFMWKFIKKLFGKGSGCCVIPNKNNGLNNEVQKSYAQQRAYNPK